MTGTKKGFSRRRLLESMAGAAALGSAFKFVDRPANGQPMQAGGVNRNSAPSQLRITDMRAIRIASPLSRGTNRHSLRALGRSPKRM